LKEIKYHKGFSKTYPVDKKSFAEHSHMQKPYVNADGYYAYCPHCENPVKLLGLLKPLKRYGPHGRHAKYDVSGINSFNKIKYENCPYHRKHADYITEPYLGEETDEDLRIYNMVREHFDQIIYLLKQSLPIVITSSMAERLLQNYITHRGWMFRDADLNNIPWVFINAMHGIDLFGALIKKDSELARFLKKRNEVNLLPTKLPQYLKVGNSENSFVNLNWIVSNTSFSVDSKTKLHTYLHLVIGEPDGKGTYNSIHEEIIEVDTYAFGRLAHSSNVTYRDTNLLNISSCLMPVR